MVTLQLGWMASCDCPERDGQDTKLVSSVWQVVSVINDITESLPF